MSFHKKEVAQLLMLKLLDTGIPEGCEWVTIDKMGDIYGFSHPPVAKHTMWMVERDGPYEVFEFAINEDGQTLHIDMDDILTDWKHLRFDVEKLMS